MVSKEKWIKSNKNKNSSRVTKLAKEQWFKMWVSRELFVKKTVYPIFYLFISWLNTKYFFIIVEEYHLNSSLKILVVPLCMNIIIAYFMITFLEKIWVEFPFSSNSTNEFNKKLGLKPRAEIHSVLSSQI